MNDRDEDLADIALSPKAAARWLGLSVKTLANHRCSGAGVPFIKGPGRRGYVRYTLSSLQAYRAGMTRRSTSDKGGAA